jgi:hypothetical protein
MIFAFPSDSEEDICSKETIKVISFAKEALFSSSKILLSVPFILLLFIQYVAA